jgi:hypothetical protein
MLNTLAQIAISALLNPSSKPLGPSLHKLILGLLGLLTAAILGSAALIAAVVAGVLYWAPPFANPASLGLIIAAALGLLATALWLALTKGHTAKEIIEEAFTEERTNPLQKAGNSMQHVLHAFERGWHNAR